jgi:predicted aldo/keto reductase-like oxidoreductase
MGISRRDFLGTSAAAGLTAATLGAGSDKGGLPTRVLGKTGARVSILAFGGGSRFVNNKDDDETIGILQKALDAGVTYIDTADDYGRDHLSERRIAQAIKGKRDRLFLATKLSNRDGKETQRIVELSLKSLGVDRVDLLHIHSLLSEEDLGVIEAKGGVLEQVQKIRDQKMARFIGITCHADPVALKTALERHDFDCTQMALNAGMVAMMNGGGKKGMVPNPAMKPCFETLALPVAVRKKMGIIGMKVLAQDALVGQADVQKLLYYTLSLPVATAVVGMPKAEHVDENARLAKAFKPLPKSEMKTLSQTLSQKNKQALDRFFRHHVDA